jgi:hypothetical protein
VTIATTYDTLVSLAAGTSGIVTATTGLPNTLSDDMLPCVVTVVGPAEWNEHASGLYRQVRSYEQRVFVKAVTQGASLDNGYAACLTPLYNLGRTYVEDTTLGGTVDMLGTRGDFVDSGVAILSWAGTDYHGFTLTLRITEKAS